MKKSWKNILKESGKKTTVSYKNKDKRVSFDDSFGKSKMEIASSLIGSKENAIAIAKKLG